MTRQIALAFALLAGLATAAVANDAAPDSTRGFSAGWQTPRAIQGSNMFDNEFDGGNVLRQNERAPRAEALAYKRASETNT